MATFHVRVAADESGAPVVEVKGSITAETSSMLAEALLRAFDRVPAPARITLEMGGVDYVASPGIGSLVSFLRKVENSGGGLVIRGLRPEVRELFRMMHLDRIFTIVPAKTVPEKA